MRKCTRIEREPVAALAALLLSGACAAVTAAPADDVPPQESGESTPAKPSDTQLAKEAQNPVANLISLPLQNRTGFGIGPEDATQNTLNVQPVIPVSLSDEWNLITRTILPVTYQQEIVPGTGSVFGLGDVLFTGFVSPKDPGSLVWGVGPVALLPTSTNDRLGTDEWGLGISGLLLGMPGHWVLGGLVNNVWTFGGSVNQMTIQPFVNYNLPKGWYLTSSPIINADWNAPSEDRWRIPLGGGFGKVFKVGKQAMNVQIQAFDLVESPELASDWTLRIQLQFLFPK